MANRIKGITVEIGAIQASWSEVAGQADFDAF